MYGKNEMYIRFDSRILYMQVHIFILHINQKDFNLAPLSIIRYHYLIIIIIGLQFLSQMLVLYKWFAVRIKRLIK
jgi:hypothetical protein